MLSKILNLDGVSILDKNQQTDVKGGGGTCAYYLPSGSVSTEFMGGNLELGCPCVATGVSKDDALGAISGIEGAKWCCDSCNTASWLPQQ